MRDEVPHLKRPPSELHPRAYLVHHPADGRAGAAGGHLLTTLEWIGWDRILFATDYPHWDFDDPETALKAQTDRGAAADGLPRQCAGGL